MKFIDSCVGNIARKIEDEFNESDHPRDKGGKFTSKGGEGRGGGKEEKLVRTHKAGNITTERADALNEAAVALEEAGVSKQKILKMSNEGDLEGMQKLLKSSKNSSEPKESSGVDREEALNDLVDLAFEGFGQNGPDVAKEFFANMGMSKKEIAKFEKENVPDGDWGEWEAKIEELIRENPSKAVENMGEWADEFEGVFDEDSDEGEEDAVSLNALTGDKMYGPAVVNALQYHYDGDAKKVGAVVKQLNDITSDPDMWGEYTVQEIIEDLEGRFGELSDIAKRHIDTYLRKTNPAEWASEAEYWKKKFKNNPGPHSQSFYE